MKNSNQLTEAKSYANLRISPPFSSLLKLPAVVLAVHWAFQGMLYMEKSERRFKLLLDLLLTAVFALPASLLMSWYRALACSFLLAHTLNFLLNGQIWSGMKGFGWVRISQERFDRYRDELARRATGEASIIYAAAFGSLARQARTESSDLDIRVVRAPGFRNGMRACMFVLRERARAFLCRFPLDIFLLDSTAGLARLNPQERAVVFIERKAAKHARVSAGAVASAGMRRVAGIVQESLFTNAGYLVAVQALNSLIGFLFWALAARHYSAESVGQVSTMVAVVAMVSYISLLGFDVGLVQFLSDSPNSHRLLNTLLTFSMAASTASSLLFLLSLRLLPASLHFVASSSLIAWVFLSFTVATAASRMANMVFLARRKGVYLLCQAGIINFTRLAFLLFLIQENAFGLAASLAIGMVIASAASILYLIPRIETGFSFRLQIDWQELKRMTPFATSNLLSGVLTQLPQWLLPVMVLSILGPAAAAYAYIPWMLGTMLMSPGAALSSSAFAEGAASRERFERLLSRAVSAGICYSVTSTVVVTAGAPWILKVFGSGYALSSVSLLRWLAIATPFAFVSSLYITLLRLKERLRQLVLLGLAIAVITLTTAYFGLPKMGIAANGFGWLAAQLFVSAVALVDYLSRRIPRSVPA